MSAIKPPGAPPPPIAPTDVTRSDGAAGPKGASFDDALAATAPSPAAPTSQAGATEAVLVELRAGRIDATEAIDRIVAATLSRAPQGTEAAREELRQFLRAELEADPVLGALLRGQGRG